MLLNGDAKMDYRGSQVFKIGMLVLKYLRKGLNDVSLYKKGVLGVDWENVDYILRFLEYYYTDILMDTIRSMLTDSTNPTLLSTIERNIHALYPKECSSMTIIRDIAL